MPGCLARLGLVAAADPPAEADRHGFPLPAGALARLGSSRLRHHGAVRGFDLSPDGKTVVTAGYAQGLDGAEVRVWDAATGDLVRAFDALAPADRAGPRFVVGDMPDGFDLARPGATERSAGNSIKRGLDARDGFSLMCAR